MFKKFILCALGTFFIMGCPVAKASSTDAFGISAGVTTGVGFSYEKVWSDTWGLQVTALPAVPRGDDLLESTVGLTGRLNVAGDDVVTRYIGASVLGVFSNDEPVGGTAAGILGLEVAPNKRGTILKLEFPLGVGFDANGDRVTLTPWLPNVSLLQRW